MKHILLVIPLIFSLSAFSQIITDGPNSDPLIKTTTKKTETKTRTTKDQGVKSREAQMQEESKIREEARQRRERQIEESRMMSKPSGLRSTTEDMDEEIDNEYDDK